MLKLQPSKPVDTSLRKRATPQQASAVNPALPSPMATPSRLNCACGGGCPRCQQPRPSKIHISQPGDAFEREADRVAETLMHMQEPAPGIAAPAPSSTLTLRRAPLTNVPGKQTLVDEQLQQEGGNTLARKVRHGGVDEGYVGQDVAEMVDSPDSGRRLAESTRSFYEPRLGADLSNVRVHEGAASVEAAARLDARAFTYGSHIWLGSGERESDRRLLGHELAHVLQYSSAAGASTRLCRSGPNYVPSGREAEDADQGTEGIKLNELGFTGDHMVTSVPGGLGTPRGANIDDPDGSAPVWTAGSQDHLVAYTLGAPPTMFASFSVAPPAAAVIPDVQVRALVDGTVVGQAGGLSINGDKIEDAAGTGKVSGIGGGSPIPGARVGGTTNQIQFETSTDGGRVWIPSGSARVRIIYTVAAPSPPGGFLREDVLDWGSLMIGSAATLAENLRRLVQVLVSYNPAARMPESFIDSDDVMISFNVPHQCDSQAYLLRYLALSFGVPANVLYFWMGTPTQRWVYPYSTNFGYPNFQCDRPKEDMAPEHPHFSFHALTEIGGVLHDAAYDLTGLPEILEQSPGALPQTAPRDVYRATTAIKKYFHCPH